MDRGAVLWFSHALGRRGKGEREERGVIGEERDREVDEEKYIERLK